MLLIPAIYLECKGRYLYKKYSFKDAKKDFSENEWKIIEKMTEMRDKFYYNPFWLRIITKQRMNFWPNVIAARLLTRAPKETEEYVEDSRRFIDSLKKKVDVL
ncbi:MAG: hypothetical protein GQ477_03185, partial [Nanohaloarchaea archaeon]|nr:hypothetical protein [Candidatus Nanohaloarchaea archaeon]